MQLTDHEEKELKSRLERIPRPSNTDMNINENFVAKFNSSSLKITANKIAFSFQNPTLNNTAFLISVLGDLFPLQPVHILDSLGLLPNYVFYDKSSSSFSASPLVYVCAIIRDNFNTFQQKMRTFKQEGKVQIDKTRTNEYHDEVKRLDLLSDAKEGISEDVVNSILLDYIEEDDDPEYIDSLLKERIDYFCLLLAETTLFCYKDRIHSVINNENLQREKVRQFFTLQNLQNFFAQSYQTDIIDGSIIRDKWNTEKNTRNGNFRFKTGRRSKKTSRKNKTKTPRKSRKNKTKTPRKSRKNKTKTPRKSRKNKTKTPRKSRKNKPTNKSRK